ncbi:hypothetical protein ElyMa_004493100 [Elysia marginata]|uniref:Uncharacterized protein n=1 Tax=Elysia marginata TaxID=1093978 RepID=A0AAV4HK90_9GAST|nr:hypothetical protein ElyMa_004493100 [Elysia marginata]
MAKPNMVLFSINTKLSATLQNRHDMSTFKTRMFSFEDMKTNPDLNTIYGKLHPKMNMLLKKPTRDEVIQLRKDRLTISMMTYFQLMIRELPQSLMGNSIMTEVWEVPKHVMWIFPDLPSQLKLMTSLIDQKNHLMQHLTSRVKNVRCLHAWKELFMLYTNLPDVFL